MGLIGTILGGNGKSKMIFGGICILAGIIVYFVFDHLEHERVSIFGIEILHAMTSTLGRIGFSGVYFVGGVIIGLWGFMQYRGHKHNPGA